MLLYLRRVYSGFAGSPRQERVFVRPGCERRTRAGYRSVTSVPGRSGLGPVTAPLLRIGFTPEPAGSSPVVVLHRMDEAAAENAQIHVVRIIVDIRYMPVTHLTSLFLPC